MLAIGRCIIDRLTDCIGRQLRRVERLELLFQRVAILHLGVEPGISASGYDDRHAAMNLLRHALSRLSHDRAPQLAISSLGEDARQKQQATRGPVEVEGELALSLVPPLEPAVHRHQAAVASESAFPEPARGQALGPGYMRARRILWRPPGLEGPLEGGHFRVALRGSDRHDGAARGDVVPGRWECCTGRQGVAEALGHLARVIIEGETSTHGCCSLDHSAGSPYCSR
ncbi:hypothetical protein HALA3H3_p10007 [Halomonas sp. A3H3]|nr:hypothetical protein HALA3H3_p10007 [Halomonas sp. A3H3]